MLTVSNALLMSSATVIVRSGGLFWLNTLPNFVVMSRLESLLSIVVMP